MGNRNHNRSGGTDPIVFLQSVGHPVEGERDSGLKLNAIPL